MFELTNEQKLTRFLFDPNVYKTTFTMVSSYVSNPRTCAILPLSQTPNNSALYILTGVPSDLGSLLS